MADYDRMKEGLESGNQTSAFGLAEASALPEFADQKCTAAPGSCDRAVSDLPELPMVAPLSDVRVGFSNSQSSAVHYPALQVALLTGGDDRPYALGMGLGLAEQRIAVDFVGSNKLDAPEIRDSPWINFLNLRGDLSEDVAFGRKAVRIVAYYLRLIDYALHAKPRIFHILWNNRFEFFDRTFLMLYYRLLGKKVVLTAHNVNARKRDGCDTWFNRILLCIQYRLCSHILVHTEAMKKQMKTDFGVPSHRITVIPFGINNTTPITYLGRSEAKEQLRVGGNVQVLLFFGQIAPYKGLEYLVRALADLAPRNPQIRLVIAGRVKPGHAGYWNGIENDITRLNLNSQIMQKVRFIPDDEVEVLFKAADAVVIPYVEIFQSGVPFLAYSFGLPVIAADVGSLREDIIEGRTGFICRPQDSSDLAKTISRYFESELFRDLENRRSDIKQYANERYSWEKVASITASVYSNLSRA